MNLIVGMFSKITTSMRVSEHLAMLNNNKGRNAVHDST